MSNYTIYTTNTCRFCGMVKEAMRSASLDFIEINLDRNAEIRKQIVDKGHRNVPIIYKNDEHIATGYDNSMIFIKACLKKSSATS